jgi:hypothetical protein
MLTRSAGFFDILVGHVAVSYVAYHQCFRGKYGELIEKTRKLTVMANLWLHK